MGCPVQGTPEDQERMVLMKTMLKIFGWYTIFVLTLGVCAGLKLK